MILFCVPLSGNPSRGPVDVGGCRSGGGLRAQLDPNDPRLCGSAQSAVVAAGSLSSSGRVNDALSDLLERVSPARSTYVAQPTATKAAQSNWISRVDLRCGAIRYTTLRA